jgi:hypothetical protein
MTTTSETLIRRYDCAPEANKGSHAKVANEMIKLSKTVVTQSRGRV